MAQRTYGRALAAVALTAALTLALPAQGEAAPLNKPVNLWEWVSGLLEEKIAAVWPSKRPNERTRGQGNSKAGVCIDPNGCANYQTSTTPLRPNCDDRDEAGVCIDPNG